MRVEGKMTGLTLTLESEAEAELLWYLLNYYEAEATNRYAKANDFDIHTDLHYQMWKALDKRYCPEKWRETKE